MNKHPVLIMAVILIVVSLACSGANLENISDIGITGCTTHSGDPVIACETAKADVNGKSDAQFNFGTRVAQTGIRVAHITLRLTVEGQGEAQASVKSTGGQV